MHAALISLRHLELPLLSLMYLAVALLSLPCLAVALLTLPCLAVVLHSFSHRGTCKRPPTRAGLWVVTWQRPLSKRCSTTIMARLSQVLLT